MVHIFEQHGCLEISREESSREVFDLEGHTSGLFWYMLCCSWYLFIFLQFSSVKLYHEAEEYFKMTVSIPQMQKLLESLPALSIESPFTGKCITSEGITSSWLERLEDEEKNLQK